MSFFLVSFYSQPLQPGACWLCTRPAGKEATGGRKPKGDNGGFRLHSSGQGRKTLQKIPDSLQEASILRADGTAGQVITTTDDDGELLLIVRFADGQWMAVPPQSLSEQEEGVYHLAPALFSAAEGDDLVIPLAAEEAVVRTEQFARGVVRIHKRVETREETVDADLVTETATVERIAVNRLVKGAAPQIREENDVLIVPVLEEVLVVEKRLLLREEVHITKQRTAANAPQTVTLRREVVEVERTTPDEPGEAVRRPPQNVTPENPEAPTAAGLANDEGNNR